MSYAPVMTVPPHLFILIIFPQFILSWNEPQFDCNIKKKKKEKNPAKQSISLVMLDVAPSHTC